MREEGGESEKGQGCRQVSRIMRRPTFVYRVGK